MQEITLLCSFVCPLLDFDTFLFIYSSLQNVASNVSFRQLLQSVEMADCLKFVGCCEPLLSYAYASTAE